MPRGMGGEAAVGTDGFESHGIKGGLGYGVVGGFRRLKGDNRRPRLKKGIT